MKRRTYERPSMLGAIGVGALGDGSCIDGWFGGDGLGGRRRRQWPGACGCAPRREARGNSAKKRVMGAKLNGQVDDPMSHDRTCARPLPRPLLPGGSPGPSKTRDLDRASFAQMRESVLKGGPGGRARRGAHRPTHRHGDPSYACTLARLHACTLARLLALAAPPHAPSAAPERITEPAK